MARAREVGSRSGHCSCSSSPSSFAVRGFSSSSVRPAATRGSDVYSFEVSAVGASGVQGAVQNWLHQGGEARGSPGR